jgi:uncharacterized protein (TIGR01777 family)
MKVLLTGATGFIGKKLATRLFQEQHSLVVLSRKAKSVAEALGIPCQVYEWDSLRSKVPDEALKGVDAVIHLAGESIAGARWSDSKKRKIRDSRVFGTAHLMDSISSMSEPRPKVILCASAVGLYGDRGDEVLNEDSAAGSGFLSEVCQQWEKESLGRQIPGVRQVAVRTGLVLGRDGGALGQLLPIFRSGLGGRVGSGHQWMSWIHIDDLISIFLSLLEKPSLTGPVNAVSPNAVTNSEFSSVLGRVLNRPTFFSTPAPFLKLALGEMSQLILGGQRVQPERLLKNGFQFQYPSLEEALSEICQNSSDEEFSAVQYISKRPEEIFPFFSQAENLEEITPPWLKFQMTRKSTQMIEENTLIDYTLKIHGIPVRWQSRIEDWKPNQGFVDTQTRGPYRKWHHTHRFEKVKDGTLLIDRVLYRVPGGLLGKMILGKKIRQDIETIFNYRRKKIREVFDHG